jgi:DNA repair ATPase RecN
MTQEEEIADLKKQLSKVLERLNGVLEQLSKAQERESQYLEQLAVAHKRIEELEKQKTPPAAFVKANVKKPQAEAKQERKKRDPKHNHGRKQQHAFEQELWQLCAPYAHTSSPLHTLCERVERFLPAQEQIMSIETEASQR